MFLTMAMIVVLLITAASATSDSVTRGRTFTVTVSGTPRTSYDLWPEGTSEMTGETGDQPPVIPPGQVDVRQDPPGGPYTIGNHPISGGGTIRDDIPPDTPTTPASDYYAEVTTDASGYGVVLFQTSAATATGQQFHIKAQNPADLSEDVAVILGGISGPAGRPASEGSGVVPGEWGPSEPSRDRPGGEGGPLDGIPTTVPAPVMPLPLPTTMKTPLITVATTPAQATRVPFTPVPGTTVPLITPSPEETPTETPGPQGIPLSTGVSLAAIGIGVFLAGRRHGR
jgi:hypothetical protein